MYATGLSDSIEARKTIRDDRAIAAEMLLAPHLDQVRATAETLVSQLTGTGNTYRQGNCTMIYS